MPCKNLVSFATTIATITKDDESSFIAAVKKIASSGGIVYVSTPVINISTKSTIKLSGTSSGGIVGKQLPDGTYPVINFKKQEMPDQLLEVSPLMDLINLLNI